MAERVLITGARSAAALDLARDFSADGCEVHLADASPSLISRLSKSCAGFHSYPPPARAGTAFRQRIAALVTELDPALVIPTCEEVFHLATPGLAAPLGERLFAPPLALLRMLHDKWLFASACASWGIAVPESLAIDDQAALARFAADSRDWVFKPRFSRFGEAALIGPSRENLARLTVMSGRPWMAQHRISGIEASFYAVARAGVLTAFAAYRSDWRMRGGASYAFTPLATEQADALYRVAERLAGSAELTGQFSCDAIFDAAGQPWVIECNPRATSGVHLLAGEGALARAITGEADTPLRQSVGDAHLGPAMFCFGLTNAIATGRVSAWRRAFVQGRDVIARRGDRMPLLGAIAEFDALLACRIEAWHHNLCRDDARYRMEWRGDAMMNLPDAVRDAWHIVALSRDLRVGTVRQVVLCSVPLALFRNGEGVGALIDRCPHRNYPLSRGRVHEGGLECAYHGWRFDRDGSCLEVPGCAVATRDDARLKADAVRVVERHGAIFVALSAKAPTEPELPPDFGNPDLDHFWWQQGRWQGRAFDAIENVMDPFHTGHLHHGFIRRRDRRLPVRLHVTSHGDGIDMAIEQTQPDLGLMSRFLERDRARSVSRYHPPTIVQARWEGEKKLTLCVTAIFTPSSADSFTPFARFSTPSGLLPGWLKQAAIRLFLRPVVAQDRRALADQHEVMTRFGNPSFVSGPGDILGNRLHMLWKGERLSEGADSPVEALL